ncbi:MAG: DinB family protein [Terriglobus sp.]
MNPYAGYLDGRPTVEILRATPAALQQLIDGMTAAEMDEPTAPGKWSVREILAHMADCELVWAWRIRQSLETPGAMVAAFDQDVWATRYAAYSAQLAWKAFVALREWNLAVLTTVTETELSNELTHPERGTFPLTELLEMIAGHDLNHIVRLKALRAG